MRFTRRRNRSMEFNYPNPNDPTCIQKQNECGFYSMGKCTILNDTRFNRTCPFKKTKEQILEEKKKWSRR